MASLLGLSLVAAAAGSAGTSYLCLLRGGADGCCCATLLRDGGERDGDPTRGALQTPRERSCCASQLSGGAPPLALAQANEPTPAPAHCALPWSCEVPVVAPRADRMRMPIEARGPPRATASPLFIQNCSFRI